MEPKCTADMCIEEPMARARGWAPTASGARTRYGMERWRGGGWVELGTGGSLGRRTTMRVGLVGSAVRVVLAASYTHGWCGFCWLPSLCMAGVGSAVRGGAGCQLYVWVVDALLRTHGRWWLDGPHWCAASGWQAPIQVRVLESDQAWCGRMDSGTVAGRHNTLVKDTLPVCFSCGPAVVSAADRWWARRLNRCAPLSRHE